MSSNFYDWAHDEQVNPLLDPYARAQIISDLFKTEEEENLV